MNHSTTGTFTYSISKYSRSYPPATATTPGSDPASEWQHFTNPVIRLVLDVKTATTTNELEAVRLRVLWKMDMTQGSKDTEEDLDLLALSFLPSLGPTSNHLEGLPLKAVYRDTVVGIRYLYSQEDPSSPIFRRFQLSFQSSTEASAFIDSIRPICPCKLNSVAPAQTNPRPVLKTAMTMNPPANRAPTALLPPHTRADSLALRRTATVNSSNLRIGPIPGVLQHPVQPSIPSSPLRQRSSQATTSHVPLSDSDNTLRPNDQISSEQSTNTSYSAVPQRPVTGALLTSPAILPSSSLPSASTSDFDSRPPSLSMPAPIKQSIVSALSGHSSVYNLPPSALESIVAEIIREDGFLELIEKLSDIIRVKEGIRNSRTAT
ncbi:hypothetical protein CVT24_003353 [Panaeolus cyanescens]|uniref:Uncharacterized protein n=1 Tax=Panaeolus cyanescens TaxID=181874 RepID=A0A409Y6V2_9AGAR|nr:hypothetical protein CVT24_003353 [Panaeolus cyanescens]